MQRLKNPKTLALPLGEIDVDEQKARQKSRLGVEKLLTHVNPQFRWEVIIKTYPRLKGVYRRYFLVSPLGQEIMMSKQKAMDSFDICVKEFQAKTKLSGDLKISNHSLRKKSEEVETMSIEVSKLSRQNLELSTSLRSVESLLESERKMKQSLLEIIRDNNSSIAESSRHIRNLQNTIDELKNFMLQDTAEIEGADDLSAITNRRVAGLTREIRHKNQEIARLKDTLDHSLRMVQYQDRLIADLEQKSLTGTPLTEERLTLTAEIL